MNERNCGLVIDRLMDGWMDGSIDWCFTVRQHKIGDSGLLTLDLALDLALGHGSFWTSHGQVKLEPNVGSHWTEY